MPHALSHLVEFPSTPVGSSHFSYYEVELNDPSTPLVFSIAFPFQFSEYKLYAFHWESYFVELYLGFH